MAALTDEEKALLGPSVLPFERTHKVKEKVLKDGEAEKDQIVGFIHDGINNGFPKHNFVKVTIEEVEKILKIKGRLPEKCFLWIIDDISIKIIREKTRAIFRTLNPLYVCHTNLTGGGRAFAGGEMFFGEDGKIYINPFSDRYGTINQNHWNAVLDYFRSVGYTDLVDILDLINIKTI